MATLKLEEFRSKNNMTQREIAKKLNIAHSYYWKWEKGKSFPNSNQILDLCSIFKCTPNDLYGIKGDYAVNMSYYNQD